MGCATSLHSLSKDDHSGSNNNVLLAVQRTALVAGVVSSLSNNLVDKAWEEANSIAKKTKPLTAPIIRRSGWNTVRIFISSTFKDFDSEREILVKKVFPDLRVWCQSRHLHLVECDLRWVSCHHIC